MSNLVNSTLPIVNLAAYRFVELKNLVALRASLQRLCEHWELKGTVLLSEEGINLFVAGDRDAVDALLVAVSEISGVAELDVKESYSDHVPFNRMLVKIKNEIIAFGVPGVDPKHFTSRRISSQQLRNWLTEGRRIRLLDTRNRFEVAVGTFENAIPIELDDFRDFPAAVKRLPEELKEETVVTFCTGGIRCEKAAPFLEREGFRDVYQLDGGILKYFENCGGEFFEGQCFVFDKRVALDADLSEAGLKMCYRCQSILSAADQGSTHFLEGESCPHCFRTPVDMTRDRLIHRNLAVKEAVTPLPGSEPYDNVRPISVPARCDGMELLAFFSAMHTHLSATDWETACHEQRVTCRGKVVQPGRVVRGGERLLHLQPANCEPDVNPNIEILDEDDELVVVNKPAPLPMHPCGRFNRNSLSSILNQVYAPNRLRAVHRLDADTSGVVVFGKTREVAHEFHQQFRAGQIAKLYVAQIHGCPLDDEFDCRIALDDNPGPQGVRLPDPDGQEAVTRFRVLSRGPDGTCFLEARPMTGRTNQIRAHLWHLGFPIVGDSIYHVGGQLGQTQSRAVTDPPLRLHAAAIGFRHPQTGLSKSHAAPAPPWLALRYNPRL